MSAAVDSLQIHQMARTKNVGGGLGDEDLRRPPRLPADPKGKATKKVATALAVSASGYLCFFDATFFVALPL